MSAVNDGGTEGGQNIGFAAQLWTNMRPASTAGPQTSTCRGIAHDRSTAGARNIGFAHGKATYKRYARICELCLSRDEDWWGTTTDKHVVANT